jgi:hypothetical protein
MANPVDKYDRKIRGGAEDLVNRGSGRDFFGITTVGSGYTNIATTEVNSDSPIFLSVKNIAVGSGTRPPCYVVTSVNPGVGFQVNADRVSSFNQTNSYSLMWEIKNPA